MCSRLVHHCVLRTILARDIGNDDAASVPDGDERLTAPGVWTLPRSLARAWGSGFDAED
jgi:hypothetical protein